MNILKKIKLKDNTRKLSKPDWIIMGIMVLIYGILSFIRLGDTSAPNTYYTFQNVDDSIVVTLREKSDISSMRYYTGNNIGQIMLYTSIDGKNYDEITKLDIGSVFSWQDVTINSDAKYIKFVSETSDATLGDIVFYDGYKNIIPVVNDEGNPLFDETNLVPENISFMNSTYFDEIYYARTAYEYLHGIPVYEWTHPPLGKLIMTIPIALFGFSPFTYRLMANLFGILMIPTMYILAKRIFKNRKWALLGGLLMMFDNFHFAHTRIALIDGFQVAFILLSVLFMKEYMDVGKNGSFKKKTIYLLLSGTFIGCAIDTKWNALYVGLGLAITFFIHLFREYHVNVITILKKNITINRVVNTLVILVFIPFILYYLVFVLLSKNISSIVLMVYYFVVCCFVMTRFFMFIYKDRDLTNLMFVSIVSFIAIPIIIYIASYLLFPNVGNYDGTLKGIADLSNTMYEYHAYLDATHPFSSSWFEWPIMLRPVWFYTGSVNGLNMTISDIGNPAIWWCGVVSFIYVVINAIKKKNIDSVYIIVFVLSTFLPYIFVGRLMFMYHYFITLPFIMLAIVSFIKWLTEKTKNDRIYYGYIGLIIITFIIFYPVVSALPVSSSYIESLRWLSEWYF